MGQVLVDIKELDSIIEKIESITETTQKINDSIDRARGILVERFDIDFEWARNKSLEEIIVEVCYVYSDAEEKINQIGIP